MTRRALPILGARWPDGFVCPNCGLIAEPFRIVTRPGVLECRACRRQAGLLVGTVMECSHTPLSVWFWAAYLVASQTPGMSAVQFQRQLGLTRYETAFGIQHKLRAGMVRPDQGITVTHACLRYSLSTAQETIAATTIGRGQCRRHGNRCFRAKALCSRAKTSLLLRKTSLLRNAKLPVLWAEPAHRRGLRPSSAARRRHTGVPPAPGLLCAQLAALRGPPAQKSFTD